MRNNLVLILTIIIWSGLEGHWLQINLKFIIRMTTLSFWQVNHYVNNFFLEISIVIKIYPNYRHTSVLVLKIFGLNSSFVRTMQIIFVEYSICRLVFLPNHINFIWSMDHDFHDIHESKSWIKRTIQLSVHW